MENNETQEKVNDFDLRINLMNLLKKKISDKPGSMMIGDEIKWAQLSFDFIEFISEEARSPKEMTPKESMSGIVLDQKVSDEDPYPMRRQINPFGALVIDMVKILEFARESRIHLNSIMSAAHTALEEKDISEKECHRCKVPDKEGDNPGDKSGIDDPG